MFPTNDSYSIQNSIYVYNLYNMNQCAGDLFGVQILRNLHMFAVSKYGTAGARKLIHELWLSLMGLSHPEEIRSRLVDLHQLIICLLSLIISTPQT